MGAISKLVGVLRQTSCPAVAAASAGITAAIVGATSSVTAVSTVVVTHYVAAAVMRMRHHLVRHVFPARAKQLLQPDDGRDDQSDFPHEERFPGDGGDRAQRQRQQGCRLEGQGHHQRAENLLGFLCETIRERIISRIRYPIFSINDERKFIRISICTERKSKEFVSISIEKKERKKDCFSFSVSRGTTTISLFWMITI